ncbi:MAG: FGGY-family carbohydrate kinase [Lachnospiraceae bacterium]|nr:FGGY-family carbohydrate kinase [Lachnospiraceae bacterium]
MDFIGIDVGTSGCKASVVSQEGMVKKSAQREYKILKNRNGWACLSLSVIWNSVRDVLKEISSAASEVKAAAVSSLGETIAFLDEGDRLLMDDGMTYIDSRNTEVWKCLERRIPEKELYEITGKTQPRIATVNQYNYWKATRPEVFEKARKILFVDSFVAYMLSGEAAYDYSTASNTLFYDINTYRWSDKLADAYGIDLNLFPQVTSAGTFLGNIRREVSEELNLPAEVKILVGCHDQISAAIGGGAVVPGDAVLGEGSTEALNLLVGNEQTEQLKNAGLQIEPFIQKGMYISLLSRLMHGNCIKWFVNNFASGLRQICKREGCSIYDHLNQNCPGDSSGIIFLPYLSNTYFPDIDVPMGSFIGMDTTADIYHLYRAILEGLSCETAELFDLADDCGVRINKITASGGVSRSSAYMQIKADITGKRIYTLENTEAGIHGLAMLCAVQFGCYKDLSEASRQFSKTACCYTPEKDALHVLRRHRVFSNIVKKSYLNL